MGYILDQAQEFPPPPRPKANPSSGQPTSTTRTKSALTLSGQSWKTSTARRVFLKSSRNWNPRSFSKTQPTSSAMNATARS